MVNYDVLAVSFRFHFYVASRTKGRFRYHADSSNLAVFLPI